MISSLDLGPTALNVAGLPVPDWMQGRDLLAASYEPRPWIVAARDRCDETVDRIRCVRTARYKYIRNGFPQRPYLQPNRYKDNKAILNALRRLHAAGKLNDAQSLVMADRRPPEELYDLQGDPHELRNLAADPQHAMTVTQLRATLDGWIESSGVNSYSRAWV